MKTLRKLLSFVLVLALILPMIPQIRAQEEHPLEQIAEPLAYNPGKTGEITVQGTTALQHPTKEAIIAKRATVTDATSLYTQEPSVTAPYATGKLTDDFLESGITYLNYIRFVAGLPEVSLSETFNKSAQYGAVLLAAIDELTHYPAQPADMDDAFYQAGYDATTSSNLSSRGGYYDLTDMLKSSLEGCMNDNNSLQNLSCVGHRRWLLNPVLSKVGFGHAESKSGRSYIATKVFDRSGTGCSYEFISWPASGNHPTNLFNCQNPWSVTLNPAVFFRPSLDTLKVTLTRVADGKQWIFDSTTGEPNYSIYIGSTPYLTVDTQYYGIPNCIIFHPGADAVTQYEGLFRVEISGIYYTDNTAAKIEYEVDFFDINSYGCDHSYTSVVTEPTCEDQGYTTYTCAKCGESYVADYTDPVDHSYVDGKCIWCGKEEVVASGTCGENLTWTLNKSGLLTISGQGEMYDYTSSQKLPWYSYRSQILYLTVDEDVTSLSSYACYGLNSLREVSLPVSLERIGDAAFAATALVYVYIPSGVTELGDEVFSGCASLEYIGVAQDNTAFSNDDFGVLFNKNKTLLICCPQAYHGAYVIPNTVETVAEKAFDNCRNLTEVTIPGSVKELERYAFAVCENLAVLNLNEGLEIIANEVFMNCHALTGTMVIPSTVKRMGSAFFNCPEVTAWKFLGDMPEFEDYTFGGIDVTVYYPADNATWTEEKIEAVKGLSTFVPYNTELPCADGHHVPGLEFVDKETGFCAYCDAICHSNGTTVWAIESDGDMIIYGTGENGAGQLDYYGYSWTKHLDKIKTLTVEDGVTGSIFDFAECANLKTVYLSDDITQIDKFAFALCPNLEQINIPSGLTYLGSGAFRECVKLTEIILPATVSEIGSGVVGGCTSLETLRVDENNPYYFTDAQGVLYSMDGTHLYAAPGKLSGHYTVPGSTSMILGGSFWGCTKLTEVTISEGVRRLDACVFMDCTSLKTVTFPDGLMDLSSSIFENCTALETILFEGDAPMGFDVFPGVTATAYYPAGNETWTEEVMQNYGGNITWVPYGETEDYQVTWKYTSTSLNGTIDMNFYALLSENLLDAEDAYVRFSYADKVVDIPLSAAKPYTVNGEELLRFTVELYAKYVSEEITVQFIKGDQPIGNPYRSSVMKYCMNRIAKSTNPKQVALCKALLNYASTAQLSLNYNTGNLANAGLPEADKVLPDNIDVSAYKAYSSGSEAGISVLGSSLVLEGKVIVRVYFTLEQGRNINSYSFTINGKAARIQKNETGYYLETEGIPAKELENMFTFRVGGLSYTYGPMSYVRNKLSSPNPLTVNMVKALYAYYAAAEDYFS